MSSVTGMSLRARMQAFIDRTLDLMHLNERIARQSQMPLLLPPPKNATAATWERTPPTCPIHGVPKFRSLVTTHTLKFGEWYCSDCEQEQAEMEILSINTGKMRALFPDSGQLARRIRLADMRHSLQEKAVRDALASYGTQPDLTKLASSLKPPEPKVTQPSRADLFSDIPPQSAIPPEEDDLTEKRGTVHRATDTIHIPAMTAEVLLEALAHGDTHAQSTGENECVSDAWLK